ncbi:hypothetical protein GCM10010431_56020 [Streptomyces kunmingensis]
MFRLLVVEEVEPVDPALAGDDLALFVTEALLQEVDDDRHIGIKPLSPQELPQPGPEIKGAGPQKSCVLNDDV